jgi:hypothetical protein
MSTHSIEHNGQSYNPFLILGITPETFQRERFVANYNQLLALHATSPYLPIIDKSYMYIRQWEAATVSRPRAVGPVGPVGTAQESKFDLADFNRRFEAQNWLSQYQHDGYAITPSEYGGGGDTMPSYSASIAPSDDITRQTLQLREARRRQMHQDEPSAAVAYSTLDTFDHLGTYTGVGSGSKLGGTDYMEAHTDEVLMPEHIGFVERNRTLEQYMTERGGDIPVNVVASTQHRDQRLQFEQQAMEDRRRRLEELDRSVSTSYEQQYGRLNLPSY